MGLMSSMLCVRQAQPCPTLDRPSQVHLQLCRSAALLEPDGTAAAHLSTGARYKGGCSASIRCATSKGCRAASSLHTSACLPSTAPSSTPGQSWVACEQRWAVGGGRWATGGGRASRWRSPGYAVFGCDPVPADLALNSASCCAVVRGQAGMGWEAKARRSRPSPVNHHPTLASLA